MLESSRRLKECLRLYGPVVLHRCRAFTGDEHEAEDLMQEVFTRLCDVVQDPGRDREDVPWKLVQGVMRNVFFEYLRQKKRSPEALGPAPEPLDATSSHERADLDEQRRIVRQLVAKLCVPEQQAVLGRHFLGLSLAELTELLELPRSTVVDCYNRGIMRLREMARDHGVLP